MKNYNTGLTFISLFFFFFCCLVFQAGAADSPCFIDKLLEGEHCLRGDVNNDGLVNEEDLEAILGQVNTNSTSKSCNPADVNADGQVNSDDEVYLRDYLSSNGPAPSVANVQYCSSSPCIVRLGDAIVELTAKITAQRPNRATWEAVAYTTDRDNRKEIARYRLDLDYGQQMTTLKLSYERKNSPFGLVAIPRTEVKISLRTPYSNEGIRGEVDTLTALMGLSTLITAKGNSQVVLRSPSENSSPVNIPDFFLSKLTDACFLERDACYQRGGSDSDKKTCDDELFNCLGISDIPRPEFWCGSWIYRKEYIKEFLRLFNSSSFRYHKEATLSAGLNFNQYSVESYGEPGQDANLQVSIEDKGATLHLTGNGWKKIAYPYTITANTILEFDFKSGARGDIHGLGFDKDNSISSNWTFKLYGTQTGCIADFDNYAGSAPAWKYYKGKFNCLFFVNDHDTINPNAESFFRNVLVYEEKGQVSARTQFSNRVVNR